MFLHVSTGMKIDAVAGDEEDNMDDDDNGRNNGGSLWLHYDGPLLVYMCASSSYFPLPQILLCSIVAPPFTIKYTASVTSFLF